MISQKTLKLYKYVDGVNDIPFYGDEGYVDFILSNGDTLITSSGETFSVRSLNEQIEIGEFKYTAQRMGAAPSLSFTLMFPECLDGLWDDSRSISSQRHLQVQSPMMMRGTSMMSIL